MTWNIQAGKGVDGIVDIERIASVAKRLGDSDVLCFQEVLQESPDGLVTQQNQSCSDVDQVKELSEQFPGYQVVFGPAVDRWSPSGRIRFGNLILSRLPVLNIALHKLPQPSDPDSRNMSRQATEVVVGSPDSADTWRIITTHLEFFSSMQRSAHIEYLHQLGAEMLGRSTGSAMAGGEGIYAPCPETANSVFCGDFNLTVDSVDYQRLCETSGEEKLLDAWRIVHARDDHAPTCGIYDHEQWPEGAHCRDYFFVSKALHKHVKAVTVDTETNASDHQPLVLTLAG